jgi:very-short-patch-repair endonuclease
MAASNAWRYDVDHRLSRAAARYDGVLSREQLFRLGLTARQIERRVNAGRLIAVYRGVYAVGHAALSDRGRVRAALLAAGPDAIASHMTAAALWRIIRAMPAVIELTTTARARRNRPGLIIHETKVAPPVRTIHDLPLTVPLKTLADLAATQPAETVERATTEALARRLVTPDQLRTRGHAPTRSRFERDFRELIRQAGLPQPHVNVRVGPYEVDFLWPDHRVIVETDGWATHGTRRSFEDDRAKDAALQAAGYVVVRFTWRQIKDEPLKAAAQLAQVLAQAIASGT